MLQKQEVSARRQRLATTTQCRHNDVSGSDVMVTMTAATVETRQTFDTTSTET